MNFGHALEAVKRGQRAARSGWNGDGMWIALQMHERSMMSRDYLYIKSADDQYVPWVASQTDLLALDWYLI